MHSLANFAGKIYPDLTFSVWRPRTEKKRKQEKDYDRAWSEQWDSYCEVHKDYKGVSLQKITWLDGRVHTNRFISTQQLSQKEKSNVQNPENSFDGCDSQGVASSYKKTHARCKRKYGSRGITKYGRKAATCIPLLLSKKYTRDRLGFGTATIPALGRYAIQAIMESWSTVVKRFFESIRRVLSRKGRDFEYISVTEVQEGRFARTGIPALHLHWIYVAKDKGSGEFYISANQIRDLWGRSLFNVLRQKFSELEIQDISTAASIDCQRVTSADSGYLGKYISKGVKVIEKMREAGWDCFPGQWWTASHGCKKLFKESIRTMSAKAAEMIFYNYSALVSSGHLYSAYPQYINLERGEVCVAVCGKIGKANDGSFPLFEQGTTPVCSWG